MVVTGFAPSLPIEVGGALASLAALLFLLTGATLLSHPTAYFALALAAWGTLRLREEDGWIPGVASNPN